MDGNDDKVHLRIKCDNINALNYIGFKKNDNNYEHDNVLRSVRNKNQYKSTLDITQEETKKAQKM